MSTILEDYGNETVLNFIRGKIKNNNNVEKDILDKINYVEDKLNTGDIIEGNIIEDRSSQGFYYERLWDICIKFGATELTLPSIKDKLQTRHIIGINPNKDNIPIENSNCWDNNKLNKAPGGYLSEKVRSGNSGGYSDITFVNQKYDINGAKIGEEELYFISVKYFKDEKEIAKYDIGKLCALVEKHKATNRTIKIFIFVKNKQNAIKKFEAQNSSSNILIKYINPDGKYEQIYDLTDLQNAYFKLKKILEQFNYLESTKYIDYISKFEKDYLKVLKEVFIPRFHQKLFVGKIDTLIKDGKKNILVGAIPRSGKSFVMAGTILEYIKSQEPLQPNKKFRFLLMTPAPNETFGEYEAIFNKYIEFNGIDVVTYKDEINIKEICKNNTNHCIIIISKQKLGWSAGSKGEELLAKEDVQQEKDEAEDELEDELEDDVEDTKDIKTIEKRVKKLFGTNPNIDVMFLDEAHFGMSTTKAQNIVKLLHSTIASTVKIYVTATYNKPLQAYGVAKNCIITWSLNDIHIMKTLSGDTINNNAIREQFGEKIYENALEYFGDKTGLTLVTKFQKDYSIFPKPYFITSLWDKEFLSIEKLKIGNTEFDWNMNTLFDTNGDSTTFKNDEQLKEMMRYYFGYPDKKKTYIDQTFYRKRGIIPRIQNICLNKCRTLQQQHNTSQLWFLPVGTSKIKNKVVALINLLSANEFKDIKNKYHFFIAIDIEDKAKAGKTIDGVTYMNNPHNIKADIEKVEKDIKAGKVKQDNLIILTGQRLQLGISLRNVDIVTLWNSTSSSDAIFQMLFRSMTEVDGLTCEENEYCPTKRFGFMVDMNPQRALLNVNLFDTNISKNKDIDSTQKYRLITDLINIDEDVLYDKYGDDEKSRNEFVKELFNKLYASWNINVENIKKVITAFTFDMIKLEALKPVFQQINIGKNRKKNDEIDIKKDDEMFPHGKKKEKIGEIKIKEDEKTIEEKEINLQEIAAEIISEFISLLNIFTLYMDNGAQCILTDNSKSNAQITLIGDIDILKNEVFKNEEIKDNFLKILNGRLSGNADEPCPEKVIQDVLDAMDSLDDKLIMNKIILSQKKHYYTINEPTELLNYIDTQLKPKDKEKKENGEVFTPLTLVNEMMTKLDDAYIKEHGKSIFTEVEFKWFDPAVGIGNFPIILYQRLMKGLVESIKDEEERRKHILEQMIYASELTPKNVFIYKKIFCGDKYKLNIYEGDTLKMDIMKIWGLQVNSFDVILGNPPYNKGGIRSHTGKQLLEGEKSETIWTKFIEKSFEWLKPNGFLVFINPLSWLKKSHSLHSKMLDKHIIWLKLWDNSQSKGIINADIPISLYVLQNTFNGQNKKTEITSILKRRALTTTSTEYLNPKYSIPLAYHSIFNKLIIFIETKNIQLEYKTKTIKSSGTKTKIPIYYTLEDNWAVDTYTIKEGLMVKKAIEQHPDANKRKLIISNKASFTGAFIDEGRISLTGNHKFYILGNNLELVKKILGFKIINIIGHYTKYGQDFLDNEAFTYIPDIRKLGIIDITEDDFYKLIGLTFEEINQIKYPLTKEFLDEEVDEKIELMPSTSLDKIYNPLTSRYIKNTPSNQKKIEQLSLKKTAGKGGKNKKTRNKKSQKQKYKKSRSNKTRSKKTRKLKHKN